MVYVIGIIVIALSTLLVWKSAFMGRTFPIAWAEAKFGSAGMAGSTTMYRLVGVLLILGSFLAMTGVLQKLIILIFGGGRS